MKVSRIIVVLALFITGSAMAEMKPAGTLIPMICGNLNRSVNVCIMKVQDEPNHYYLQMAHFLKGRTFIPVKRIALNPGIAGVGHFRYEGRYAQVDQEINTNYIIEKEISLETMQVIVPGSKIQGHFTEVVGGELTHDQDFEMDFMAVTQSL